jgi:hypothetical protein
LSDPEPDFIPVADAVAATGYSRAGLYRFAGDGLIQLVKRGARRASNPPNWNVSDATTPRISFRANGSSTTRADVGQPGPPIPHK